jgi:transcriptional regulator with PAS, ATPase and Fis domain
MKEFITIQIEQDLLIKVLHKANEKKGSISDLVKYFFEWITKKEPQFDFINVSKRQPKQSLDDYIKQIEKAEIQKVCKKAESKQVAAEMLGITYRSFRYKLDVHGIEFYEK